MQLQNYSNIAVIFDRMSKLVLTINFLWVLKVSLIHEILGENEKNLFDCNICLTVVF